MCTINYKYIFLLAHKELLQEHFCIFTLKCSQMFTYKRCKKMFKQKIIKYLLILSEIYKQFNFKC